VSLSATHIGTRLTACPPFFRDPFSRCPFCLLFSGSPSDHRLPAFFFFPPAPFVVTGKPSWFYVEFVVGSLPALSIARHRVLRKNFFLDPIPPFNWFSAGDLTGFFSASVDKVFFSQGDGTLCKMNPWAIQGDCWACPSPCYSPGPSPSILLSFGFFDFGPKWLPPPLARLFSASPNFGLSFHTFFSCRAEAPCLVFIPFDRSPSWSVSFHSIDFSVELSDKTSVAIPWRLLGLYPTRLLPPGFHSFQSGSFLF